jgi:hypothetical protein
MGKSRDDYTDRENGSADALRTTIASLPLTHHSSNLGRTLRTKFQMLHACCTKALRMVPTRNG